jgi:hypothetical protein
MDKGRIAPASPAPLNRHNPLTLQDQVGKESALLVKHNSAQRDWKHKVGSRPAVA